MSPSADPLISIIMPVYNGATLLRETLTSIFDQDYRPIEVTLVDDGSTDDSLAIARSWQPTLRTFHQDNAGPAAARNRGIEAARGDYIAFMDADDLWPEGKLRRQIELLQARPDLDFVLGRVQVEYLPSAGENPLRFRTQELSVALFLFGAGLFLRSLFARAGLLSEDLRNSEDVDWFMRAREAGATWLLTGEVELLYRRHGANLTDRIYLEKTEIYRVLARSAARRRMRPDQMPPVLDRLADRSIAGEGPGSLTEDPKSER
jgi:glycosyltransferase involved in cell wall biosynthesis